MYYMTIVERIFDAMIQSVIGAIALSGFVLIGYSVLYGLGVI